MLHTALPAARRSLVVSAREAVAAVEAYEPRQCQYLQAFQSGRGALKRDDLFLAAWSDGLDQVSAEPELLDQRRRYLREGRRDEDGVEGRAVGYAATSVSDQQLHVMDSVPGEVASRAVHQVGPPLDAHDISGQPCQQRGLETKPGADLKHVFIAGETQTLDHPRRQRRLRGHLLMPQGKRPVLIGDSDAISGDESRTWGRTYGLEQALVHDTCQPDGPDQILLAHPPTHLPPRTSVPSEQIAGIINGRCSVKDASASSPNRGEQFQDLFELPARSRLRTPHQAQIIARPARNHMRVKWKTSCQAASDRGPASPDLVGGDKSRLDVALPPPERTGARVSSRPVHLRLMPRFKRTFVSAMPRSWMVD